MPGGDARASGARSARRCGCAPAFALPPLHARTFLCAAILLARSPARKAFGTDPAAAVTPAVRFVRQPRVRTEGGIAVGAGNVQCGFLHQHFQIFGRGDVPHGFAIYDYPVLKGVLECIRYRVDAAARKAALYFRDSVDSAPVTTGLVLHQRTVFESRLLRDVCSHRSSCSAMVFKGRASAPVRNAWRLRVSKRAISLAFESLYRLLFGRSRRSIECDIDGVEDHSRDDEQERHGDGEE